MFQQKQRGEEERVGGLLTGGHITEGTEEYGLFEGGEMSGWGGKRS